MHFLPSLRTMADDTTSSFPPTLDGFSLSSLLLPAWLAPAIAWLPPAACTAGSCYILAPSRCLHGWPTVQPGSLLLPVCLAPAIAWLPPTACMAGSRYCLAPSHILSSLVLSLAGANPYRMAAITSSSLLPGTTLNAIMKKVQMVLAGLLNGILLSLLQTIKDNG